jgi:hypothetical protein
VGCMIRFGRNNFSYSTIAIVICIIIIIIIIIVIVTVIVKFSGIVVIPIIMVIIGMRISIIVVVIVVVIIIINVVLMTMMGNGVYLIDGSNLGKSLARLVNIALDEGSDTRVQSVAHDFWLAALLPASQNKNRNNKPPKLTVLKETSTLVTLMLPFRPSAINRPPTSVKLLSLCITPRHTSRQSSCTSHKHAPCHDPPPLTCPFLPS